MVEFSKQLKIDILSPRNLFQGFSLLNINRDIAAYQGTNGCMCGTACNSSSIGATPSFSVVF